MILLKYLKKKKQNNLNASVTLATLLVIVLAK